MLLYGYLSARFGEDTICFFFYRIKNKIIMLNEAIKKQFLTSADYFKAKRWEGKPLSYKLKYAVSNHPEMTIACVFFALIAPALCAYRSMNYETSKYKTIEKYRMHFTIVRDDHPDIEEIKREKEYGREYFPKY